MGLNRLGGAEAKLGVEKEDFVRFFVAFLHGTLEFSLWLHPLENAVVGWDETIRHKFNSVWKRTRLSRRMSVGTIGRYMYN